MSKQVLTKMSKQGRGLAPPPLHPHLDPRLRATRATLRLPQRRPIQMNGMNPSNIDPETGRPYTKRALPEPQCRCAAAVTALSRGKRIQCGKCVTCGQPSAAFRAKSTLADRARTMTLAQQHALANGYVPSYQKVVTFNLKPHNRTNSAPPLLKSRSLEDAVHALNIYDSNPLGTGLPSSDYSSICLRKHKVLPNTPFNKAPTSPTMPMAKLKLYRDLLGQTPVDPLLSLKRRSRVSPAPKFSLEHSLGYRGSLPGSNVGSPIRTRPPGASFFEHYQPFGTRMRANSLSNLDLCGGSSTLSTPTVTSRPFPSITEVTRPPFMDRSYLYDRHDYNYDNYFRQHRSDLQPFYKSAPPSRPVTPPALFTKYMDRDCSPRNTFKKQLKYFVEERKGALGMPADYMPQTGSESDLNALLTLYSCPPDPVLDPHRAPPAGAPTYQSVPQAYARSISPVLSTSQYGYLRKHSSSPSILGVSPTAQYPPGLEVDVACGSPFDAMYGASSHATFSPYRPGTSSLYGPTPTTPVYQGISGLLRRTPSPLLGTTSLLDIGYDTSDALYRTADSTQRTYRSQWASINNSQPFY